MCPAFEGNVGKRLHIGFNDPSEAIGTTDFIRSEFERVRNEIKNEFTRFTHHMHRMKITSNKVIIYML